MPRVADFTPVFGPGQEARIGDHGTQHWQENFSTGGAVLEGVGYFLVEFRGLTQRDPAPVKLNGTRVGRLAPYNGNWSDYHTQIVDFPANNLNDGQNTVEINAVPHNSNEGPGHFDNFTIENMVCHYHQEA